MTSTTTQSRNPYKRYAVIIAAIITFVVCSNLLRNWDDVKQGFADGYHGRRDASSQ